MKVQRDYLKNTDCNGFGGDFLKECKSCAFAFFFSFMGPGEAASIIAAYVYIPTQNMGKVINQFFPGYMN